MVVTRFFGLVLGLGLFVSCAAMPQRADAWQHGKDNAAQQHKDEHKEGTAAGDHHADPEPVLSWAMDTAIWTLIVFLLLLFVLRRYAWGPMLEGLQKREDTIRLAVEEAKIARQETERVRAEFKAEMDKAYAEIPRLMAEAREDAQRLKQEMVAKANAEIQTERQRLRREIDTARDQALQQIWEQTAHLATLVSAKAIRRTLTEEDQKRLVDQALDELRRTQKDGKDQWRELSSSWQLQGGSNN